MNSDLAPTLPFDDLPPRPPALWREHTGARVAEQFPEAKEATFEMIRSGMSISEVARVVGPMCGKDGEGEQDGLRKIIRAWIVSEGIDTTDIARRKAAVLRDIALDTGADLTAKAKVGDLGAVAMMLTQANQVERNLGGLPSEIKVTTKLTMADLERMREATAPPMRDVIDVEPQPPEAS